MSYPYCGRASVMINSATAAINSANRNFLRAGEMPAVSVASSRASRNCVSNLRRDALPHQKNNASAGGTTSSSQRNLDVRSAFSWSIVDVETFARSVSKS